MKNKTIFAFIVIFSLLFGLFAYQNKERTPLLDDQGGYLSLDLYIWGAQLVEPLSVPILMLISFVLGGIVFLILKALLKYSPTYDSSDYSSDF